MMHLEIERKFLVKQNWPRPVDGTHIRQGYLCTDKLHTVRIRLAGPRGVITIKGARKGLSRPEYEYEIPQEDAEYLLNNICRQPVIEKIRYLIEFEGFIWEVDVFSGENRGLVLAEIELDDDKIPVPLPDWIGKEVTADARFYNARLAVHPFKAWKNKWEHK